MRVRNAEFLQAVAGEDAPFVHVTGFPWDPNAIPEGKHLKAWGGSWASRYTLTENTNQYFCISIFNPDQEGVPRRRKALYLRTFCIVLDDVREKLDVTSVNLLPPPSWILETSPGSEQWGYILTEPCTERHRVENLLDGLVANGLAPDGKDPGMKGVTRYVRLPEGVNNKASKLVDGRPWQCRMLEWHPERKVTLEQLAAPFFVNLDAVRREARLDGAADLPDHPVLQIPDIIHIKEVRSEGRFDITCPWVEEHTGGVDNGTGLFTNGDGSIGFKCHHGACEHRTTKDFIRYLGGVSPEWAEKFSLWRVAKIFSDPTPPVAPPPPAGHEAQEVPVEAAAAEPPATGALEAAFAELRKVPFTSKDARDLAKRILQAIEGLPAIDQQFWHQQVCDEMHWSKKDFAAILKSLREEWYATSKELSFMDDLVYIKDLNQIYEYRTEILMSVDAMQNAYSHKDPDVRKTALVGGAIRKVDSLDFAPKKAAIFEENGRKYANLWTVKRSIIGAPGDPTPWLRHIDVMGWGEYRQIILWFMAFTLVYPEIKINWMMILGGYEGSGKDYILTPLIRAEPYTKIIHGDELYDSFNDYIFGTKLLIINEGDTSDRDRGAGISNKLKPLAAAPPDRLRVNRKYMATVQIRNILSVIMTTNSQLPVRLQGVSRRILGLWSDLSCRDERTMDVAEEWKQYWHGMWSWMNNGGAEACIWYLRNQVDLSQFNPGSPPPVTDFLRDMQESSKSLQQQTIEAFIRNRVGAFAADLLTAQDALQALKAGALTGDYLYCDVNWFTPERVQRILKDIHGCSMVRCRHDGVETRLWAVRDSQKYLAMPSENVFALYQQMVKDVRKNSPMRVVGSN